MLTSRLSLWLADTSRTDGHVSADCSSIVVQQQRMHDDESMSLCVIQPSPQQDCVVCVRVCCKQEADIID